MTRAQLEECLRGQKESPLDALEPREFEVFSLITQGSSSTRICEQMALAPDELSALKSSMLKRLKLKDEVQLIQFAARQKAPR